ncbi:MAG: hypothetical protein J6C64_13645 [Lachnospiraceae bacterium]|nr:hypothetical protein [Lachnospiraceae bacterium]
MGIIIFIGIIILLIKCSPDPGGATANIIAFGIEVVITIIVFGINPILGIIVGYLFLRSWDKQ